MSKRGILITFAIIAFMIVGPADLANASNITRQADNTTGQAFTDVHFRFLQSISSISPNPVPNPTPPPPNFDLSYSYGNKEVHLDNGNIADGQKVAWIVFYSNEPKLQFYLGRWTINSATKAKFKYYRYTNTTGGTVNELKVHTFIPNTETISFTKASGFTNKTLEEIQSPLDDRFYYQMVFSGGQLGPGQSVYFQVTIMDITCTKGALLNPRGNPTDPNDDWWCDWYNNGVPKGRAEGMLVYNPTTDTADGLTLVFNKPISAIYPNPPDPFTEISGLGTDTIQLGGALVEPGEGIGDADGWITVSTSDSTGHFGLVNEVWTFQGEPLDIPTLTEWGLIIFGVVLIGFITWVFLKRRKAIAVRV